MQGIDGEIIWSQIAIYIISWDSARILSPIQFLRNIHNFLRCLIIQYLFHGICIIKLWVKKLSKLYFPCLLIFLLYPLISHPRFKILKYGHFAHTPHIIKLVLLTNEWVMKTSLGHLETPMPCMRAVMSPCSHLAARTRRKILSGHSQTLLVCLTSQSKCLTRSDKSAVLRSIRTGRTKYVCTSETFFNWYFNVDKLEVRVSHFVLSKLGRFCLGSSQTK